MGLPAAAAAAAADDAADRARSWEEYVVALEEERRKIEVFRRELPLCLDLVAQTIESYRRLMATECGEEWSADEGRRNPVLEEFVPLKWTEEAAEENSDCRNEADSGSRNEDDDGKKTEWLKSAQLWNNQRPEVQQPKDITESTEKPIAVEAVMEEDARGGGRGESNATAGSGSGGGGGGEKEAKEDEGKEKRKARRCWSEELHRLFVDALQQLGGCDVATPKQIREVMNVDGLTNDEVKSHLQKYRLHSKKPSPTARSDSSSSTQAPQLVLGFWVPQAEYAAVAAAAAAAMASFPLESGLRKQKKRKQTRSNPPTGALLQSK